MATPSGPRPLHEGMRLRSYRLLRQVGIGADGEVWAAADATGQQIAIKARPRAHGAEDPRIFQEFERLRTLRIPNVVRVLTVDADQGYVFFTMELAAGEPLDVHVAKGANLAERVKRCARSGSRVAQALAGIHRLGLAHRDIKPANILVAPDGTTTVLDFGTSRFGAGTDGDDAGLVGTPAYMAPEQRIGLPHDHRVDIYALGVTLHQALSGLPAGRWVPGQVRPSLALIGPDLPRALAHAVNQMLALDPAQRPSAVDVEDLLERVASGRCLPPAPWPSPTHYQGEVSHLLNNSAVVVGVTGSGRRRAIAEARWLWYRKGYRSVAGSCTADTPWSAPAQVLQALLTPLSESERATVLASDAASLAAVWPRIALPPGQAADASPDPTHIGRILAATLDRAAPIAVVLYDLDQADPATARALAAMAQSVSTGVRIWGTSQSPGFGLRALAPPAWSAQAEAATFAELLPAGPPPPPTPAATPLLGCARAWRHLARLRGELAPPEEIPSGAVALAVLAQPFPRGVAENLTDEIRALLAQGVLRFEGLDDDTTETQDTEAKTAPQAREALLFADLGTLALALADPQRHATGLPARCLAAATAWRRATDQPERVRQAAALAARAGRPSDALLRAAIREELDRGRTIELDRWLRLHQIHHGPPDAADFELAFARLLADLELRPSSTSLAHLDILAARARDRLEGGLASWLRVVHEARRGDRSKAISLGTTQANRLAAEHPGLAADMLREVALAHLAQGEVITAVQNAQRALSLAKDAASRNRSAVDHALSRSEGTATTTLSAALLYAGRIREATELCRDGAQRCRHEGQARGEGALLANRAIGLLYLGQREAAQAALARAREVQPRHGDPVVLANLAVTQARLAVEHGNLSAGQVLVAEGLTAAAAVGDAHLLGEAWCAVLEAAVHRADPAEAQRALAEYGTPGVGSSWDHWPAVLARWRWLIGDLQGALQATDEPREGHGELCIRAERCRLLLVAGRYDEAASQGQALADQAEAHNQVELSRFARLVAGAARGVPDSDYRPQVNATRTSRWVQLYLGALHLDAIRRRLRGENVDSLLRQLRARSRDVGHRLYAALARTEGW